MQVDSRREELKNGAISISSEEIGHLIHTGEGNIPVSLAFRHERIRVQTLFKRVLNSHNCVVINKLDGDVRVGSRHRWDKVNWALFYTGAANGIWVEFLPVLAAILVFVEALAVSFWVWFIALFCLSDEENSIIERLNSPVVSAGVVRVRRVGLEALGALRSLRKHLELSIGNGLNLGNYVPDDVLSAGRNGHGAFVLPDMRSVQHLVNE